MAKRFYRTDTTPDNFRALWDKIHAALEGLDAANATIRQQAATIASLQANLTVADRNARNALIASSTSPSVPTAAGSPPGSGGPPGPPPPPPPPPGSGICSSAPLNPALPTWFYNALVAAGQPTTSNCLNEPLLGDAGVEAACNANDFTPQRDSGCNTRARLYHQGNHGLWGTFCGQWDASQVADYHVNVSITYSDNSTGWGWS